MLRKLLKVQSAFLTLPLLHAHAAWGQLLVCMYAFLFHSLFAFLALCFVLPAHHNCYVLTDGPGLQSVYTFSTQFYITEHYTHVHHPVSPHSFSTASNHRAPARCHSLVVHTVHWLLVVERKGRSFASSSITLVIHVSRGCQPKKKKN